MLYNVGSTFIFGGGMPLFLNEIFYSIQGESLWSGLPCIFVRLSGCNLRCRYCDTQYAYEPGEQMTLEEISAKVEQFNCRRLTITGGEPLLQEETPALVTQMIENGYAVSMETNGSINIGQIDQRCMKVVDLKCPSSGMQDHNCMENVTLLGPDDQLKFVIANKTDFEFAVSISKRLTSEVEAERILFSPVHGVLPADQLSSWILESGAHARLHIQLHKILWPDKERGV